MDIQKLQQTAAHMTGKTFQYAKQIHYVIEFRVDVENEKCFIKTNIAPYDRPFESIYEFLKFWRPANSLDDSPASDNEDNQVALFIEQENSRSLQLMDTLNDAIIKVKTDNAYVPQAKTIINGVNAIVNIAKLKVSLFTQLQPFTKRISS